RKTEIAEPKAAEAASGPTPAAKPSSPTAVDPDRDKDRVEVERLFQEFQFRNHWEVLEIQQGSGPEEIQQAFFRGAKRFHPDRFRRITDPDFQEKLSYVFRRFNEAQETLTSGARAGYEALADKEAQYEASRKSAMPSRGGNSGRPAGDATEAIALFRRAQQAYESADYWNAIRLCQEAVDMAPERAEVYHLLGLALSKNPKWRQDAEKNLRIATNLDPWKADYFVALGSLYLDVGLHLRARKAFEQARVVDPMVQIPEE
ncbi:MAG: DnaJ domain-containing protein, partial [Vicinamibacteria bacterium]